MDISQDRIEKVLTIYNSLKDIDVQICNYESDSIKRHKDMMFGKSIGYEEVLKILGILE